MPPHRLDSPADVGLALRVLVIEGHPDYRQALCALLPRLGCRLALEAAGDGEEGLARAAARPPDLALIGLSAPPQGGHEVARRLRAALGQGPFLVALSSYAEPEDLRQAQEAGFDAYGWKPIRAEEARTWLQQATARARGVKVR